MMLTQKMGQENIDLEGKHKFYIYLKKGLGFVSKKKTFEKNKYSD